MALKKTPGKLITLEGIEGCGKSTQTRLLADCLSGRGRKVLVTREPGGTGTGEAIRKLLLDPANAGRIDARAELLLYLASRQQLLAEVIIPALATGKIVLCDRYEDATLAYQGSGRGLGMEKIRRLIRSLPLQVRPDLTLLFDLEPEEGFRRIRKAKKILDRFEREKLNFHRRVRAGYLRIARADKKRVKLVDASLSPPEVHRRVLQIVSRQLK
ncbi:MAG: dTMP kinase [bacterium]|nr:dTMP kinase [bacterium]